LGERKGIAIKKKKKKKPRKYAGREIKLRKKLTEGANYGIKREVERETDEKVPYEKKTFSVGKGG